MLFPISDDDRKISSTCWVTHFLLWSNIAVFGYQYLNPEFTYGWSVIPKEIVSGTDLVEPQIIEAGGQQVAIPQQPGPAVIYLTLLSAMFMHGGVGHIGGNMLYLWIFGDNVEHRFGHIRFLIFYLISGFVASFAQIAVNPDSVIPNLGASGAIWGILGAYMVLFPHNKVNAVILYHVVSIPAIFVIGMWAVTQLFHGYGAIATTEQTGGVAYLAHVGGMVVGVIMGLIVRKTMPEEPDSILSRNYRNDPRAKRYW